MSTDNPFAAPTAPTGPAPEADRDRLRRIATAQRHVNLAVLFYLCLIPLNIGIASVAPGSAAAGLVFLAVGLGVMIYGAVAVYSLASLFRGRAVAVIYVVGLLVPLLGLILLVTISSKATKVLKENGIRVGLLGANPSEV